jgi:hypothetical protein
LVLGLAFVLALAFLPFAIVVPLRVRLMCPIISCEARFAG